MRKSTAIFGGALICVFLAGFGAKEPASETGLPFEETSSLVVDRSFGKMPLYFIRNEGQVEPSVGYYIQGKDKTIYFTSEGLTYVLSKKRGGGEEGVTSIGERRSTNPRERLAIKPEPESRWVVKLDFVGANRDVQPSGEEKTGAVISYFRGSPEEWRAGLPTYSRVVYRELWPGIDLVYYGTVDRLKYEFIVQPGADPSQVRLAYRGTSAVGVNEEGQLEVVTPAGALKDDIPVAWQEVDGKRRGVAISYELEQAAAARVTAAKNISESCFELTGKHADTAVMQYGFRVGNYDRTQTLVLDPTVLVYCGYIGGIYHDYGNAIAVDSGGNAYVAGTTGSGAATFPVKVGPDLTYNTAFDAFVAKVNSSGTALIYCGYIGGDMTDGASGIAVDGAGNAYVTGSTESSAATFPVKTGPDLTHNGNGDAFVAKVNSSGTALVYCGYIGGSEDDGGSGIAVDSAGNAYVSGSTNSDAATFPEKTGPDLTYNGNGDAFVAKVNSSGTALVYCGYIGGSEDDGSSEIDIDNGGNAYITGCTWSSEATFPVTGGPDVSFNGGHGDAFVAKVNSSGSGLVYCGYIGGSDYDGASGIAVDSSGNAYIIGSTESSEATFPVIVGPNLTYGGVYADAFVAKVNSSGSGLVYCGYIGGSKSDFGYGIAVDSAGNVYVTGDTSSTEATFPAKKGPDLTHNGGMDVFVAKVSSSGAGLVWCGYIGGGGDEHGSEIAIDSEGNAYATGTTETWQSSFPVKVGPDLTHNDGEDAFVAKIAYARVDFLGTWDGTGVYYRNSETGKWIKLATPANLIAAGDLGGDNVDDLIAVFPSPAGVWARSSSTGTWAKLSTTTAKHISTGDMNGDARVDLLATWDGTGVYYRNSVSGAWTKIGQPANLVAAGDLDGDNKDDPIIIFPTPAGVWVKYSKTATWAKLSSTSAKDIASGDMNGDGRDDLVATWDGTGVYYRNSISGAWVKMSLPADQVTAGDTDGDGTDDLIASWTSPPGVYVKSSKTGKWAKLADPAKDMAAGVMRGGIWGSSQFGFIPLDMPVGGYAENPLFLSGYEDLSAEGPGGWRFAAQEEENLIPLDTGDGLSAPGPGDPGLTWVEQDNLFPQDAAAKQEKGRRDEQKRRKNRLK